MEWTAEGRYEHDSPRARGPEWPLPPPPRSAAGSESDGEDHMGLQAEEAGAEAQTAASGTESTLPLLCGGHDPMYGQEVTVPTRPHRQEAAEEGGCTANPEEEDGTLQKDRGNAEGNDAKHDTFVRGGTSKIRTPTSTGTHARTHT